MRDFSRQTFLYILFQSNLMVRIQVQKELDFITKKKSLPPTGQTSPSIQKPRQSSVILNNLVEIAVNHAVCLIALAVEGLLVHVLIHIRCTPAAHLHGIFL